MKFENISQELRHIADMNGGFISPSKVVEFAKNPKTHLHVRFEWDDHIAAEQYRLQQARHLIRLELTVIENSGIESPVRLYFSMEDDRTPDAGYRIITDIFKDETLKGKMLDQALRELKTFQKKYKTLSALSEVFKAIQELDVIVKSKDSRLKKHGVSTVIGVGKKK
jgi:hypothetical protein